MKKFCLFTLIIFLLILTSCSSNVNQEVEDKVVKIWWYEEEPVPDGDTRYNQVMKENIINKVCSYADLNDIKIDIKKYSYNDLSYEDYVLKRNVAISNGDANLIFDTVDNLYPLREKAGKYEKIKNYENIFENFKNQYCIPTFTDMRVCYINNDLLEKYNLDSQNVITPKEYYEIKQNMKKRGAKFKLNRNEIIELIDYYFLKNNIEVITADEKYDINKEAVENTIHELVEDIKNNYDFEDLKKPETEYKIIEKKTGCILSEPRSNNSALSYVDFETKKPSFENRTLLIMDNDSFKFNIPCAFIPENNKNEDAYSLVDTLLGDGFQISIYNSTRGVIINSQKLKDFIGFGENWNYVGIRNAVGADGKKIVYKIYPKKEEEKLYELLTKGYQIIRNKNMTKFFTDSVYDNKLKSFVYDITYNIIETNFQYDNFNKDVDDFITNLNIRYN